mmetsp:Transcript_34293/g.82300  ORF Transcript_34293/g.82300 Transcript_34293/m.82300 type:complete len:230 (+) Transcript_34293:264-953(+)
MRGARRWLRPLRHRGPSELKHRRIENGRLPIISDVILLLVLCRELLHCGVSLLVHCQPGQNTIPHTVDHNRGEHIQIWLHGQRLWRWRPCTIALEALRRRHLERRWHLHERLLEQRLGIHFDVRVVIHDLPSVQLDVWQVLHFSILAEGHISCLGWPLVILLVWIGFSEGQALLAISCEAAVSYQSVPVVACRCQGRFQARHGHGEAGSSVLWHHRFYRLDNHWQFISR